MPTPPAGFQAVVVHYACGDDIADETEVTFGCALPAFDLTNVNVLASIFFDDFKACLNNSCDIRRLVATDSGLISIEATTAAVTGTFSGTQMTPNVAYLLRKVTASGGRRNRGRMYLPGVNEGNVDGTGAVDGTAIGKLNTAGSDFITDTGAADIGLFILHSDGGTPTEITSFVASPKVATQRRRLRR